MKSKIEFVNNTKFVQEELSKIRREGENDAMWKGGAHGPEAAHSRRVEAGGEMLRLRREVEGWTLD